MKPFTITNLLVFGLALSLVATGCKHKNTPVTPLPHPAIVGNGNNIDNVRPFNPVEGIPTGGGELANFDPDQMAQDRTAFAAETVYFDYDSSAIKGSEQSKIAAVASALRSDMAAKLLVEGNCDERGTEEYNRSLGERRALAAREALATVDRKSTSLNS